MTPNRTGSNDVRKGGTNFCNKVRILQVCATTLSRGDRAANKTLTDTRGNGLGRAIDRHWPTANSSSGAEGAEPLDLGLEYPLDSLHVDLATP